MQSTKETRTTERVNDKFRATEIAVREITKGATQVSVMFLPALYPETPYEEQYTHSDRPIGGPAMGLGFGSLAPEPLPAGL